MYQGTVEWSSPKSKVAPLGTSKWNVRQWYTYYQLLLHKKEEGLLLIYTSSLVQVGLLPKNLSWG